MQRQLFEGERTRFAAFDADKDAETLSKWTHDPEFIRMVETRPVRPLAPFHVKKQFEEADKETGRERFYFVIRTREDDRAIGFAEIRHIEWNHGNAEFNLGIASPGDRGKGLGTEALGMLLRYAFEELNLYRLGVQTMEYNDGAQRFLARNGFCVEVCRRQAIYRDGRYWDALAYGILAEEWSAVQAGALQSAEPNLAASAMGVERSTNHG